MTIPVMVSVMGLLTVVAIYFWWVRKLGEKPAETPAAVQAEKAP